MTHTPLPPRALADSSMPPEPVVCDLTKGRCRPCEGGVSPYTDAEAQNMLAQLKDWRIDDGKLVKTYEFRDHYQVLAFVNALAWISHREDHHPVTHAGYNNCRVEYWTHAIDGLSENDFICAAKCDALFNL